MEKEELKDFLAENPIPPIIFDTDSGHGILTRGKRDQGDSMREKMYNSAVEGKIGLLISLLQDKGLDITHKMLSPEQHDTPRSVRIQREHEIFDEFCHTHLILGESIHADGFPDPSANGTTTYIFKGSSSVAFAQILHQKKIERTGLRNRGILDHKKFDLLKMTKAPFVLSEAGFMTNPKELKLLKSDAFRNINAIASVDAVLETAFLHHEKFITGWQ